jgi:hypothetical protein
MGKNVTRTVLVLLLTVVYVAGLSYTSVAYVRGTESIRESNLLYMASSTNKLIIATMEKNQKIEFMSAVQNIVKSVFSGEGLKFKISKNSYSITDEELPGASVTVNLTKGDLVITTAGFSGKGLLKLDPELQLKESSGELVNYVVNNLYAKAIQIGSMHDRSFLTLGDFQTGLTKIETPKNVVVIFKGNKISVYLKEVPEVKTIITVAKEKISFIGIGMNPTKSSK